MTKQIAESDSNDVHLLPVQIDRRFVQSNATAVHTKCFGESQADHDTCQNALSSRASSTHVHLGAALGHDDAVVVRLLGLGTGFLTTHNLDIGDSLTLVGQQPELTDNLVDLGDLDTVEEEKSLGVSK